MMQPTPYPHVNDLLDEIAGKLQAVLGSKLVGLYLFGSLVTGDYDDLTSDADLLAALERDLTEAEFAQLDRVHQQLLQRYPEWDNRIEILYYSLYGLRTFRTERSPIAVISPGEPFNLKDAGSDWLMNWYMVREKGITLYGVPPQTIIAPIAQQEFVEAVRAHILAWETYIKWVDSRPSQSYTVLTLCRGLYTITHGEQVSKRRAALWAQAQFPQWAELIASALVWRRHWRDPVADPAATMPEIRRFVAFAIQQAKTLRF